MALIHVTKANFAQEVLQSPKTVLLDFWATWCGPCKMIAPFVEEIAKEREDIVVGKVDVDEEGELANRFGIASIPTLVVFKDGQEINRATGFRPKEAILALL